MSATEILQQISMLPVEEQQEIFVQLTKQVVGGKSCGPKPWLGKTLSFDEACDVVFRENRELLKRTRQVNEPIFLTLDEILHIHSRSLAEHGGSEGVRELGLVESALASAKNTFCFGSGDVFDVAASYAFHLAESQAFLDGNKRTAVVAALVFLARNGVYARPSTWKLYTAMIDVAEKKKTKADLAGIFRQGAEMEN